MWARYVEVVLGAWLLASPFVFGHFGDRWSWSFTDLICGTILIGLALISLATTCRRAHLWAIALGFWLVLFGYLAGPTPNPPALQNDMVVGLAVLMMAIIPSDASAPPISWQDYFRQQDRAGRPSAT